ncbi:PAS domain-containing protein [Reichenbachiella agariperforans]|uniref:PAS domain-containing protein n=1 Tax=Reichenbachiella agariperforans TaxID=156994 RepID=UPI001C0904B5|nr:PAS domain-containing protein [Reichenbachiella agariperforans]MBU2915136.1 PAS domain-containing protein [Reichenbachiella agariperforans]
MTVPEINHQVENQYPWLLRRTSLHISYATFAVGALVMLGWIFDVEFLKRPISGLVAMNPLTAFCFMLSGIGHSRLCKRQVPDQSKDLGVILIVGLMISISVAKLISGFLNSDFQIDQVLFARVLTTDMVGNVSNSMAPNTAVGFLLLGVSIYLSGIEKYKKIANALLLGVFIVGFFSILGYLYGIGEFLGVLAALPMSLHTAVGFILAAVGLVLYNSQSGFMKVLSSRHSGGRVAKIMIPLVIVIPVFFGYLRLMLAPRTTMSSELGISILITGIIIAFLITTWFLVRTLNRNDEVKENLEQSQGQFQQAFEYSAIGMALVSTSGKWLSTNRQLCEMLGYSKEELELLTFQDVTHPDDLERDINQLHELIDGVIDSYQMEKRYFRKDGKILWVLLSVSLVKSSNGQPLHFVSQIENITQRKEVEDALKNASNRLTLATQAAKVGIWEYEIADNELIWDSIMHDLYGLKEGQFTNQYEDWRKTLHPDDVVRLDEGVANAISGAKKFDIEFRVIWPDQSVHHIRALALVEHDEKGQPLRMVGTNWDITVDKNYKEALKETTELAEVAKQEAVASAKAKENFLSNMSHEIRTPLNAILGVTNLLLSEDMKREHMEHLQLLKFSGENLLALINDILDYNKIDAGKIEFEEVDFDLKELLNRIKQTLSTKIEEKELELILRYDEALPYVFVGDSVRVAQVINNLMSNAIKFTEEGFVKLDVSLVSRDDERATIHFEVQDTGIGIQKTNQSMIFENFSQASSDTTRKFGGTGLGLAITQKLLELMGSEIRLDSDLGLGSVFSFDVTFPIGDNESVSSENRPSEMVFANVADKNIKVLVAEDNRANQIVLQKFLDKWGVKTDFAENGMVAMEKAKSETYNLILMDLQMPEMDGYQATTAIRDMDTVYAKQVPIVALSASAMMEVRKKVKELGMTDFITKPFNPEELYKKIIKYHHVVNVKNLINLPENAIYQQLMNYAEGDASFVSELVGHYLDHYKAFRIQFSEAVIRDNIPQLKEACEKISKSNEALSITSMDAFFDKIDTLESTKTEERKMFDEIKVTCHEILEDLNAIKTALN